MTDPVLTKSGQTASQLSTEFFNGLKQIKVESQDMLTLFDAYLKMERAPFVPQAIIDSINNVRHTPLNAADNEFMKEHHPNISKVLLAWIAMASDANPFYISTFIGLICTEFYKTHSKKECVTLAWYGENGGRGVVLDWRNLFPWIIASQLEDRSSVFVKTPAETLYPIP